MCHIQSSNFPTQRWLGMLAVLALNALGGLIHGQEGLLVDGAGQVGIGIDSPLAQLHVGGAARVDGPLRLGAQSPSVYFSGDIVGARFLAKLGGNDLSFASDNVDTSSLENVSYDGTTFRVKARVRGDGQFETARSIIVGDRSGRSGVKVYSDSDPFVDFYAGNSRWSTINVDSSNGVLNINDSALSWGTRLWRETMFEGPLTANYEVTCWSDVFVYGTLNKLSSNFCIDHPLDPERKNLYHGVVESPRYELIYRGTLSLVNGRGQVSIDADAGLTTGTFAAIARQPQIFLQNMTGWEPVKGSISAAGALTVRCKDDQSTDTISWMVVAERCDPTIIASSQTDSQGHLITERPKPEVPADSRPMTRPDGTRNLRGHRGHPVFSRSSGD